MGAEARLPSKHPEIPSPQARPAEERTHLFSEQKPLGKFHGEVDWRMVTDNRHKYIWNNGDRDELYDLETDPWELENLIDRPDQQNLAAELGDRLDEWMERTADPLLKEYREQRGSR